MPAGCKVSEMKFYWNVTPAHITAAHIESERFGRILTIVFKMSVLTAFFHEKQREFFNNYELLYFYIIFCFPFRRQYLADTIQDLCAPHPLFLIILLLLRENNWVILLSETTQVPAHAHTCTHTHTLTHMPHIHIHTTFF